MTTEQGYVYVMSWYESDRHRVSHSNMYFLEAADVKWGFCRNGCRITYQKFNKDDQRYTAAVESSKAHDHHRVEDGSHM